jgi:hypothetical protein
MDGDNPLAMTPAEPEGDENPLAIKVGRCGLTVSKPVLKLESASDLGA